MMVIIYRAMQRLGVELEISEYPKHLLQIVMFQTYEILPKSFFLFAYS